MNPNETHERREQSKTPRTDAESCGDTTPIPRGLEEILKSKSALLSHGTKYYHYETVAEVVNESIKQLERELAAEKKRADEADKTSADLGDIIVQRNNKITQLRAEVERLKSTHAAELQFAGSRAQTAETRNSELLKIAEELDTARQHYQNLLLAELNETVPIAAIHGWKTSRFMPGKEAREQIKKQRTTLTNWKEQNK